MLERVFILVAFTGNVWREVERYRVEAAAYDACEKAKQVWGSGNVNVLFATE